MEVYANNKTPPQYLLLFHLQTEQRRQVLEMEIDVPAIVVEGAFYHERGGKEK